LKKDIPKFKEHYPVGVSLYWENWISHLDEFSKLSAAAKCPLGSLLSANKINPTSADDADIPQNVLRLREKETRNYDLEQHHKNISLNVSCNTK